MTIYVIILSLTVTVELYQVVSIVQAYFLNMQMKCAEKIGITSDSRLLRCAKGLFVDDCESKRTLTNSDCESKSTN